MRLACCVEVIKNDVVSIVGAGGKTSLMLQLAQDLREIHGKILLTTTTKVYILKKNEYDYICIGENEFSNYAKSSHKGIYVYGTKVNAKNKIIGLKNDQLDKLISSFDYSLIEADGAKKKQIKGWNDTEPVVYGATTKTIGLLDIQSLGIPICEDNVHRSEEFCKITGSKVGDMITLEHLVNMIVHPQGLFKNAKGEKILFINKADDTYYINNAKGLINEMNARGTTVVNKIIIGSIKNNVYYTYIFPYKGVETVI